ncbi:MAG TPA: ABC transporter permease [Aggregatilinea sp.]|jgi:simple sugar transport system permease protein|uniref:ABC transporter permease n=1 Tax=Aggregatilinea sp. TaxID=2806333 RepID=UPI002C1D9C68|nr:ABC transporter permease [Aggregatilinea sp.]HML21067.1 ABC transporter permease [Aggregatilinea sp.]
MISDLFTASVLIGIAGSGIRLATPYLYAAIGETFGQRSGVYNLGVEGVMLMGAFSAYWATYETGNSLLMGVLVAMLVGLLMGLLTAFINVTLKAEQGISGIGIFMFGLGLSELLYQIAFEGERVPIKAFSRINIPLLSDIPVIGEIFFQQNLLVYIAFALVPAAWFVINRTTFGLQIRAVGQNPEAADAMGINVTRVRYTTVMLGGMLAAVAGASLSIAQLNVFQQNMTAGQGFIAVALVYFGSWRPFGVMAGALLFSTVNALQLWVRTKGIDIPAEYASMAPYLLTILALVFASRRVDQPAALGKVFERGG